MPESAPSPKVFWDPAVDCRLAAGTPKKPDPGKHAQVVLAAADNSSDTLPLLHPKASTKARHLVLHHPFWPQLKAARMPQIYDHCFHVITVYARSYTFNAALRLKAPGNRLKRYLLAEHLESA